VEVEANLAPARKDEGLSSLLFRGGSASRSDEEDHGTLEEMSTTPRVASGVPSSRTMTVRSDPVEVRSPRELEHLHEYEGEVPQDSRHSESPIGLQRPSELPFSLDFLEESKESAQSPSQMPGMVMTPTRDGLQRSFDLGVPREDIGHRASLWKAWLFQRGADSPSLAVNPIASKLSASGDYRTTSSRIGLLMMSESEAYFRCQHLAMENAELMRRVKEAEDS